MTSNLFSASVSAAQPALGQGLLANTGSLGDAIGPGIFSALLNAVAAGSADGVAATHGQTDLLVSAGVPLAEGDQSHELLTTLQLPSLAGQVVDSADPVLSSFVPSELGQVQEIPIVAAIDELRVASAVFEAAGITSAVTQTTAAPPPATTPELIAAVQGQAEIPVSDVAETIETVSLTGVELTLGEPKKAGRQDRTVPADVLFHSDGKHASSIDGTVPATVPHLVTGLSAAQIQLPVNPAVAPTLVTPNRNATSPDQPISHRIGTAPIASQTVNTASPVAAAPSNEIGVHTPVNRVEVSPTVSTVSEASGNATLQRPVAVENRPSPPELSEAGIDLTSQPDGEAPETPLVEAVASRTPSGNSGNFEAASEAAVQLRSASATTSTSQLEQTVSTSPTQEALQATSTPALEVDATPVLVQDGQSPLQLAQRSTGPSPLTQQVLTSVVQQIATTELTDPQTLTMRLDPPELGEMTVRFQQTSDGIHLQFDARESVTHDMLVMRSDEIQRLLQNQELDISRVDFGTMERSVSNDSSSAQSDTTKQQQDQDQEQAGFLRQPQRLRNTRTATNTQRSTAQRIRA